GAEIHRPEIGRPVFIGGVRVTVTARDGNTPPRSGTINVTINVTNVNEPPPAPPVANRRATVDRAFTYTFAAVTDPEEATVSYTATLADGGDLPDWLTFDAESRTFSGTPESDDVEQLTVNVVASDGTNDAPKAFTLTVSATPPSPPPSSGGGGGGPVFVPPPPGVETEETDGETTLSLSKAGESTVEIQQGDEELSVEVTVDAESVGVELTLPDDDALSDLAEIEFSAVAEADAPAFPTGFRVAGGQVIVDITLLDSDGNEITELSEAATVCLPVSEETLAEAGDRPLDLLHYDDETETWTALPNAELRTEDGVSLLCAETDRFSRFAVGIRLSNAAGLQALSIGEPALSPAFAADQTAYAATLSHLTDRISVTAEAAHDEATVAIAPADADPDAPGHQVDLAVGDNLVEITVTAEDGITIEVYTITAYRVGSLPTPPPGGWTEGLSATADINALIAAQPYEVEVVWAFDPVAQEWMGHWPAAPDFVNRLDDALRPDTAVLIRRVGESPQRGEVPTAPDEPTVGVANQLPAPPPGAWTRGISGTNDPAALAAAQSFAVDTIAVWHVPSQQWLLYFLHPDAPAFIQSLTRGLLQANSIVWLLAATEQETDPEAPSEEEESEAETAPAGTTYTVAAGDTLQEIACRHHVRVEDLADANEIDDPSSIFVGEELSIPPGPTQTYTVVAGDTLADIADRLEVPLDELVEINCIDNPSQIVVGQVLAVPGS
ncbi:MAG: LysM peptidoglycan-binding domain-containing protein, partial [Chloroflexi bacterium]|nr:LysM peptidoglycan-binding domain-containing protein [Chloroflexota bacterium]